METTYREWEKRRQSRQRRTTTRRRTSGANAMLGTRERRRLVQLAVCVLLFLAVFIGKGIFPEKMAQTQEQLANLLQTDTDFKAAFASLGRSISEGEPVLDTLGSLWVEVFRGGTITVPEVPIKGAAQSAAFQAQCAFLSGYPQRLDAAAHWLGLPAPTEAAGTELEPSVPPEPEPEADPAPISDPEPEPTPEPAVEHMDYDGPPMPDNATADKYNLSAVGVTETVTPALGWVSSDFGWREHPIDGGEKFHNGVDLAVNTGTDVLAFADGTVDFIGEDNSYGLYLQIRHAGGLTTLYAHCSELLVQQGQTVNAGERVALSGATGNTTGPHLHFEIRLNGVLMNPLYYIETS